MSNDISTTKGSRNVEFTVTVASTLLGSVAVGRGFEPQSDLEPFVAEILILLAYARPPDSLGEGASL
jgi:hypothetical protein